MNDMDMKQYDGKCVRIIDISGNVFDGMEDNQRVVISRRYGRSGSNRTGDKA